MPRVDQGASDGSATAPRDEALPNNGEDQSRAPASPDRRPTTGSSAPPAPRSAASAPVDPELAAFRSRLDEQLAQRRTPAKVSQKPAKPGPLAALVRAMAPLTRALAPVTRALAPVTRALPPLRLPNPLRYQPGWLTIAPFAVCLVAAAIAWWLHRDALLPTVSLAPIAQAETESPALRQALQNERDKVEQLSDELATVWRRLTAQTLVLADHAAQERELEDLRHTLQQTQEESAAYEHLLGQERERAQRLEEQIAARGLAAAQRREQAAAPQVAALEQSLTRERDRSRAIEQEVATLRSTLRQAEEQSAAQLRALAEERDRKRAIEQQIAAQSETMAKTAAAATADKAAQEQEIAVLRESLRQAREQSAGHEQQIAAQSEAMAKTVAKAVAEATADKAAQEVEIAALRESLRQAREQAAGHEQQLADERGRIRLLETEVAARRQSVVVKSQSPAAGTPANAKPVLVAGPPEAAVTTAAATSVSDDADVPRLMARARLLLAQGDVGAARIVLERAAEGGNALALFALAETFDPAVLSGWGTMGTQGDVARARELYTRAFAEGVLEAKERLAAMK